MTDKTRKTTKKAEEEPEEKSLADQFDQQTAEAASLADLAGTGSGMMFDGELLQMEPIEGKKHYVLDYVLRPSTFRQGGSYVCMQIKRQDGTLNVINSTATVILKITNVDKSRLPVLNAFVKRPGKNPGAKPYWDFAHTDELPDLPWL